jgi:ligand-binding sensor protein
MKRIDQMSKEQDFALDDHFDIRDIIDIDFLQKFLDAFGAAVGVAGLGTDKDGNPITEPTNFTDFCMVLNRGCEKGLKRCMKSDAFGGAESARTGKPAVYYCENGLMDFGAPIIVNGKQIGAILGGQVLAEKPDHDKFRKIAKEIGVDPDAYIKALEQVPILPEKQIRAAADLLYIVATEISNMGYEKMLLSKMINALSEHIHETMATLEELTASASDVTENQLKLSKEIETVSHVSEEINGVIESISVIANQTRLLGLNATIEAARAKDAGLGFGVVAKEIQKLSEESKNTVGRVKNFTSQINESVKQTHKMGDATLDVTKEQELAIRRIAEMLESITNMTHELSEFIKAT